jgi:excisionase family DNA binding protein
MVLTTREVADYLRIHPITLIRYAREGKIPAFKIGKEWRFHKKYITRWLKARLTSTLEIKEHKKDLL